MSKLDRPIGLRGLLELQGEQPTTEGIRRLRRFFRRTEKRAGVQLLFQGASGGACYTTLSLLRRHMPEIFEFTIPSREGDLDTIRKEIEVLKGQNDALKTRVRALGAEVRTLKAEAKRSH